jgi:hypothetical protein
VGFRFKAVAGGRIEVALDPVERALVNDVLEELAASRADTDDPGYKRLHPPVYLGDAKASEEWWRLMGGELEQQRAEDRRVTAARLTEDVGSIMSDEAESLLRVLNDGRLMLAARFGVDVAEDYDDLEEGQQMVLGFLASLVDDLTGELSQGLG